MNIEQIAETIWTTILGLPVLLPFLAIIYVFFIEFPSKGRTSKTMISIVVIWMFGLGAVLCYSSGYQLIKIINYVF